ncbi:hypothetical protein [uncultured Microbacterium sp.]|uniref:hypothetical protein n=1 Tax=uncultured Microbacterium sp. TaxID=191216 RepID=UPI002623A540|nr:hypothetical protein [uncultured Microbacterium sp.]
MTPRIPLIALTATALAVVLSACSPTPKPEETAAASPEVSAPAPAPAEDAAPVVNEPEETTPSEATCESILSENTVASLTDFGWTYEQQEFRFGGDIVEGGIQCVWGDYTIASDHVQIFGWAPLDAAASNAAQQKLLGEGWQRADSDGHTYITTNPAFAVATDDDGFGMTYEFGDGWTTVSDTKQGLLLITAP